MKKYDVSAKVGSYQKDGETKTIWKTVGQIRDDGNGEYLLLDKTFNPAGLPCDPNKDQISLSLFTPRNDNQPRNDRGATQSGTNTGQPLPDVDSNIPF